MLKLTIFASGSTGNCTLVSADGEHVLIDAGISLRRIKGFLAQEGLAPDDLSGVFITHEHSDHVSGIPMLCKYSGVPVYAPRTVASRLAGMYPEVEERLRVIHSGEAVTLSAMELRPFHTMHDTPESVGYRVDADVSAGICTDLGVVTDEVLEALSGVSAAMIEANHDEEMLRYGNYPVYLKRRILSDRGHLSNAVSGELAVRLFESGTRTMILGHLSRENNTPERALETVESVLASAGASPEIVVAPAVGPLSVEVSALCSASS